jgi:hypothetical protein
MQQTDRFLDACPRCGRGIPADWSGMYHRETRFSLRVEWWAYWCSFCEAWWIVRASRRTARPRVATKIEARMAARVIFENRRLGTPSETA